MQDDDKIVAAAFQGSQVRAARQSRVKALATAFFFFNALLTCDLRRSVVSACEAGGSRAVACMLHVVDDRISATAWVRCTISRRVIPPGPLDTVLESRPSMARPRAAVRCTFD